MLHHVALYNNITYDMPNSQSKFPPDKGESRVFLDPGFLIVWILTI